MPRHYQVFAAATITCTSHTSGLSSAMARALEHRTAAHVVLHHLDLEATVLRL